jgi:N-acetylglutamate synthase-like GNAT family acetyltransferase
MLRVCTESDFECIYRIINDAARAYEGTIPADRYHQPYMPEAELKAETERMTFFGWEDEGDLVGVMALEPVKDVSLIRHAYVLSQTQKRGVGGRLLEHIKGRYTGSRLLVGTWADATWAVDFYRKHGFKLCPDKDKLLKTYWDVPDRQIETSVVLELSTKKENT